MTDIYVVTHDAPGFPAMRPGSVYLDYGSSAASRVLDRPIEVFKTRFLTEITPRLDDLLRIAEIVYSADKGVQRGHSRDVLLSNWQRSFHFQIGVLDLEFWSRPEVLELLVDLLSFATGDRYDFTFHRREPSSGSQQTFNFQEASGPLQTVDTVVLFSGGADSLAAVLEQVSLGRHPILVSLRQAPPIDRRQQNLLAELRKLVHVLPFPHVSMWQRSLKPGRMAEVTQRSRSFLFTSLAAIVAHMVSSDTIHLCDNGIVSINLPQSSQNYGTLLSRSTHPRLIMLMESLIRLVMDRPAIEIINDHIFRTRKEVFEMIRDLGDPTLLQESVSCAHTEGRTLLHPHCGICSQCIDRRFASIAAGMENYDLASRYEVDIFKDELKAGLARTHVENYLRFARTLEVLDDSESFFREFPDAYDSLPNSGSIDSFAQNLHDMFQRHQKAVNGVVEEQIRLNATRLRQGGIPKGTLLKLIVDETLISDPRIHYVNRLRTMISSGLPPAFQSVPARDERHVQDIGQGIFQTAKDQLDRESPQIPFGAVLTKPDFSTKDSLFIEFKYPKQRSRLNHVQTEMTSRVTVYRDQGAAVLFVVYDPVRTITNDDEFIAAFERHDNIWVTVVR